MLLWKNIGNLCSVSVHSQNIVYKMKLNMATTSIYCGRVLTLGVNILSWGFAIIPFHSPWDRNIRTIIPLVKEVNCQSGESEVSCQRVVNIFPAKLKDLRTLFLKVKNYFQTKDNALDVILLQDNLLNDFKSFLGCQSVIDMIKFYMDDVLPRAIESSKTLKMSVAAIKDNLLDLKFTLKRCQHFLPCDRKSKAIKQIKETYSKMQEDGMYKAMGEFDIFIDYIEEYLMSKKK